jgi:mono/diheme cytochrome c family protein
MTRGLVALVVALLAGCGSAKQDMADQPRYDRDEPAALFEEGRAPRPPPAGSVAFSRGVVAETSSGHNGAGRVDDDARLDAATQSPFAATPAVLERGRQRFTILCEPCHSAVGDGDGRVVERGFPAPPTFHQDRLREAPDRHVYEVIRDGHGVMRPYVDRTTPADRWAIVAYVRALQLSQHAPVADLSPERRAALDAMPP